MATGPAQLLESLRRGFVARLQPWLVVALDATEKLLRARLDDESMAKQANDCLDNLSVLRVHAMEHEQRWAARIGAGFDGWPTPPSRAAARDLYALVSDDELQSQLIGQPVIEGLERRFSDVIDVIDRRLWSLSGALRGQGRPDNPFAPRAVIEALLATYPLSECHASLRTPLLRQYERIAGDGLGAVYAWCNTSLSEAGHALTSVTDPALFMAGPRGGGAAPSDVGAGGGWLGDETLTPTDSSWRGAAQRRAACSGLGPVEAARGPPQRQWMRHLRSANDTAAEMPRRALGREEFVAILSLLHGEQGTAVTDGDAIGERLRGALRHAATGLGMGADATTPGAAQEDAIDMVGALLDGLLQRYALSSAASASLWRLAPPYLRLALEDAEAFEAPLHPGMDVLSTLVELWDANAGVLPVEVELHALADAVAEDIANGYSGSDAVFVQAQARLRAVVEPLARRAEVAARRAWQSVHGRERLHLARREADVRLQGLLESRSLLPAVAAFLSDEWRQSLVQAWLRDGPESSRFADAARIGESIVDLDEAASHARGHALAQGLLALQQPLRECYVACGLDESGAQSLLTELVAQLAQPDSPRAAHPFTPLAGEDLHSVPHGMVSLDDLAGFDAGRVLVQPQPGGAQWYRIAWRSPLSGAALLVDRLGARQQLVTSTELSDRLDDGRLVARSVDAPAEAVLHAMCPAENL